MKESMTMSKIKYEDIYDIVKEAGYECGKNTAMIDVFFRAINIGIERAKCETKPAAKSEVKIEKASASVPLPSSPSPLPPSSPANHNSKTITSN